MLQYAKNILPKVVSWETLFKKELIKCVAWEDVSEQHNLKKWCYDNFFDIYPDILYEVLGEYYLYPVFRKFTAFNTN